MLVRLPPPSACSGACTWLGALAALALLARSPLCCPWLRCGLAASFGPPSLPSLAPVCTRWLWSCVLASLLLCIFVFSFMPNNNSSPRCYFLDDVPGAFPSGPVGGLSRPDESPTGLGGSGRGRTKRLKLVCRASHIFWLTMHPCGFLYVCITCAVVYIILVRPSLESKSVHSSRSSAAHP